MVKCRVCGTAAPGAKRRVKTGGTGMVVIFHIMVVDSTQPHCAHLKRCNLIRTTSDM